MSSSSNFLRSSNQTTHGQEHIHRRRDETPSPHTEVCVYLKRWYILAVFSSLGMCQAMIWNCFGPISNSLIPVLCPFWDETTIALLGNWANIMNIAALLPILWYFKTKGLRSSVILIGAMMVAGAAMRCIFTSNIGIFTYSSHICAILNGIAGVVVFSAPPAVSAAWFPPEERTTANVKKKSRSEG